MAIPEPLQNDSGSFKSEALGHGKAWSAFRCLWDPCMAMDPERSQPYAVLRVVVHSGAQLLACDFGGTSDPYVAMAINGVATGQKTKYVSRSLAPEWNELFELPIHHPLSYLTLSVYDQDINGDDHMGWIDLYLGQLPFNVWVGGAFDIIHPELFLDHLQSRLDSALPMDCKHAGLIRVELCLQVNHTHMEFFALAMPMPSLGANYPALNLGELMDDVDYLTKIQVKVLDRFWIALEYFFPFVTCFWISSIAITWNPEWILPALVLVMLCIVLHYHSEELTHPCDKVKKAGSNAAGAWKKMKQAAIISKNLKDLHKNVRDIHKPVEDLESADGKKKGGNHWANSLKGLIPVEDKENLRLVQKYLKIVVELTKIAESVFVHPSRMALICVLLIGIFGILLFFLKLQVWVMQVSATVSVTLGLMFRIVPGRIPIGLGYYICRRRFHVWNLDTDHSANTKFHDHPGRKVGTREVRQLTQSYKDAIFVHKTSIFHGARAQHLPHQFAPQTFTKPTWCSDCSGFLVGMKNQGEQCLWCGQIVCPKCSVKWGDMPCASHPQRPLVQRILAPNQGLSTDPQRPL